MCFTSLILGHCQRNSLRMQNFTAKTETNSRLKISACVCACLCLNPPGAANWLVRVDHSINTTNWLAQDLHEWKLLSKLFLTAVAGGRQPHKHVGREPTRNSDVTTSSSWGPIMTPIVTWQAFWLYLADVLYLYREFCAAVLLLHWVKCPHLGIYLFLGVLRVKAELLLQKLFL